MIDRPDPHPGAPELEMLSAFLDYQRFTMVRMTEGLTPEQWRTPHPPSDLTIAGLVKHLALVEDSWFQGDMMGAPIPAPFTDVDWDSDPDWEFRTALDDDPPYLLGLYDAACERSRAVVADVGDPGALASTTSSRESIKGERFTLRWIMLHMIEETARHLGQADLIRQSIDGATDL